MLPRQLGGVFGMPLAFYTSNRGFDPDPSWWIFMMQKIDSGHVGGNWASKLPAVIGIRLYGTAVERDTSFRGMYQVCNDKTPIRSPLEIKKNKHVAAVESL
ncbi:hypothetical protein TNCV_3528351 [Trichonephila clavipes]|nr:hypothetical protein TNCV_3528351 [Trichonephila clavipes]